MSTQEVENADPVVSGLWVPGPGGSFHGEVKDFEPSHSTLSTPLEVVLPVGHEFTAKLAFALEEAPSPPLKVRVVARREKAGRHLYRVQHLVDDEFLERLDADHRRLFEVRRSRRRAPAKTVVVELGAHGVQGTAVGSLHDISPEGLAVLVPIETDQRFAATDVARLTFQLDPDPHPFVMDVRIRRRVLGARGLIYGLELIGSQTTDVSSEHHRLRAVLAQLERTGR